MTFVRAFALIAVAGAICLATALLSVSFIDYGVNRAVRQLNGGDAVAYLVGDEMDVMQGKDEVVLWITATGPLYDVHYWVSPAEANRDPHDPRYWQCGGDELRVVKPGSVMLGKSLPRGDYIVEFSTRNGSWVERLTTTLPSAARIDSKNLQ